MLVFRRNRRPLSVALAAVALTGVVSGAQASADPAQSDVINKTDGSRLATLSNSKGDGAQVISLRDPRRWKYDSEAWRAERGPGNGTGLHTQILRNVAANKCLQPATDNPGRGDRLVIKECNGSDLQQWVLRSKRGDSRWWMWTPKVDRKLAMTLDAYGNGSWNTLHLDTAYPSDDRLWHVGPNDQPWNG